MTTSQTWPVRAFAWTAPELLHPVPEQPAAQVVKAAPISKSTPMRITDAPAGSPRDPVSATGSASVAKARNGTDVSLK
jgi:hypothetical protein